MNTAALNQSDLVAKLDAIDRALLTRSPTALDEALLLVDRKEVYETLWPESGRGGDRRSANYRQNTKAKSVSFCSDIAERLGCTARLIEMKVAVGTALRPLAEQLRATPIADNGAALKTFSELAEPQRCALFEIWREQPKASFSAALVKAKLRAERDADDAAFEAMFNAFARAGSKARRRFLSEIGCDDSTANALVTSWRKRGST